MANNPAQHGQYFRPRQHGELAAYLLGMGPMPPPRPEEVAVAVANRLVDDQNGHVNFHVDDANIDPELRAPPAAAVAQAEPVTRIVVRIPINGKVARDIEIPVDTPYADFFNHVCAHMGLDPATSQIGWKTVDDASRGPCRQLANEEDLAKAFDILAKQKQSTRRKKEAVMKLENLVPPNGKDQPKKKTDGNRTTNFAYAEELRLVQEKLKCAKHTGPNRWCYVSPDDPNGHVQLGIEEVTLWARKMKDNPDLDRQCILPPNCLSLDKLRNRSAQPRGKACPNKSSLPPIHVHINTPQALGSIGNQGSSTTAPTHNLKRTLSATSFSSAPESDDESLTVSEVLDDLHVSYPKLNLPQYEDNLREHGILYAETVLEFSCEYFTEQVGFAEGAVGVFLKGVGKAVKKSKHKKKQMRTDKENYARFPSVEI